MGKFGHVSDEALVRLIDGELPSRERERVEEHVAGCEVCAGRYRTLAETAMVLGEVLRGTDEATMPRQDELRVSVRRSMAAVPMPPGSGWRWSLLMGAVALPVIAAVMGWFVLRHAASSVREATLMEGLTLPDQRLTPGVIRPVDVVELCREDAQDFDPEVPSSVQQAVFQEYGMGGARTGEYQVDYLVSPQLGGTASLANLWPEPYGAKVWNARAKDALEQRLRQMICAGQVDLPAAQHAIQTDWIAAYRKYVGGWNGPAAVMH